MIDQIKTTSLFRYNDKAICGIQRATGQGLHSAQTSSDPRIFEFGAQHFLFSLSQLSPWIWSTTTAQVTKRTTKRLLAPCPRAPSK